MAGTRRLLSMTSLAGTFLSSLSPHAPPLRERPWPAPSRLPVTSRRHLFPSVFQAQMAFTRRVIFLTLLYHTSATSSHLERLDAAKAVFFFFFFFKKKKKRSRGKLRAAFSYYIHRPSANGQQIFPRAAGLSGRLLPVRGRSPLRRRRPAGLRRCRAS